MRKTSARQYAIILYELTRESSLDQAIGAFVTMLKEQEAVHLVPYIIDAFNTYAKEQAGIKEIGVTSARELSKKELDKIAAQFGKKVEMVTAVDETLIGGMVIRDKDTILDGSIKMQIKKLEHQLS